MHRQPQSDENQNGESVVLTFNRKEGRFLVTGPEQEVKEIIRTLEKAGVKVELDYQGRCG